MNNNFWTIVVSTSLIIMLAEFADKTNLVAISLMGKTKKPFIVAFGGTLGIAFTSLIGILIGGYLSSNLPVSLVPLISGTIFIGIGVFSLREDAIIEPNNNSQTKDLNNAENIHSPFIVLRNSFSLIAIAEFGDKSQLFIISGSIIENPIAIFIGAVIGMGLVMFLSAILGKKLLDIIPENKLHRIAAIIFIVVGIWLIIGNLI